MISIRHLPRTTVMFAWVLGSVCCVFLRAYPYVGGGDDVVVTSSKYAGHPYPTGGDRGAWILNS